MSVPLAASDGAEVQKHLMTLRKAALETLGGTPAFRSIMNGSPIRALYIRYLKNVYHYATHSAVVIGLAGARSVNRSNKIAQYLLHHATEETGHEAWAYSDLKDLGIPEKEILDSRPTLNCLAMIGMEYYYAAHGNPIALLGWMYTLEALGDDVGHLIAKQVGDNLSLSGRGTYFLAGHGDADHDHILDITKVIIEHVSSEDRGELMYVAEMSAKLYIGLINDALEGAL